jgi:hypothetical protein
MPAPPEPAAVSREDIKVLSREIQTLQAQVTKLQADFDVIRELVVRLAKTGF